MEHLITTADQPGLLRRPGGHQIVTETVELAVPAPHAGARGVGFVALTTALWGGLVAFVGPTFDFVAGNTHNAWVWSSSHATLALAPGIVGLFGGMLLLTGATRRLQRLGAGLTLVTGAWFVLGPSLEPLWRSGSPGAFETSGSKIMRAVEALGYQYGVGALLIALAAATLGLLVGRAPASNLAEHAEP